MKNFTSYSNKYLKMYCLLIIAYFMMGNTTFAQFGVSDIMYVKEGTLVVHRPGNVNQKCLFYENPVLPWSIDINGHHRKWIHPGVQHVEIPLNENEIGKELSVWANAIG